MAKDSYWFRHDASVGRDVIMRELAHIYTHWGKGIYWDVIEILRDQSEYKFKSDERSLRFLADLIGCKDEAKFLNWYKDCIRLELFEEIDGYFFNPALCKNMVRWETSKKNGSKGGRPENKPKQNLDDNLNDNLTNNLTNNPTDNLNETKPETIIGEDSIKEERTEKEESFNLELLVKEITENNRVKLEALFKHSGVRDYDLGIELLKTFLTDQSLIETNGEGLNRSLQEIKKHFVNWIKVIDPMRKNPPKHKTIADQIPQF